MDEDEEEIIVPINNDLEKKIAETFDIFDHSGMRTVDAREVGTIVRALGCCPTEAEVQELVLQMEDANNPGSIHLINFLPVIAKVISEHKFEPESPAKLLEAFHILDPDGHGYITKEHMSTIITQDGEPFTQDELDEMLEIAIDPHSQTIPYEYYINQLMHEPEGEDNIYVLGDRIEGEKPPPPPPPKRFSQIFAEMQSQL